MKKVIVSLIAAVLLSGCCATIYGIVFYPLKHHSVGQGQVDSYIMLPLQ